MGDGEQQEGQAYEMMNFAHKYDFQPCVVCDANDIQPLRRLMRSCRSISLGIIAAGWEVIEVDGHDYQRCGMR